MNTNIIDDNEEEQVSKKEELGRVLFNEEKPSMITFVNGEEIHRLSILLTLTQEENKLREGLNIKQPNILEAVLKNQLILRTSIKGTRAEQGVKIISQILDEQTKSNMDVVEKLIKY